MSVTVLMPVHGDAPYIEQAILSVQQQDLQSWELLIVLDRPNNLLETYVDELAKNDPRIKILNSPGSGIVDALNFGISCATEKLIARLDSDDMMEPNRLSTQLSFFLQSPDLACLGSQMTFIDSEDNVIGKTSYPTKFPAIKTKLKYKNCIGHPSVLFNKERVIQIGSYRKALTGVEDYDLWLRLSKHYKIQNLEQPLTKYRISANQYSKTFVEKHTILEVAARLDFLFSFVDELPANSHSIQSLTNAIAKIRARYFLRHPFKIISTYQGQLVSRIYRIVSSTDSKLAKMTKCLPLAIPLAIIAPAIFFSLIKQKVKGPS